MNTQLSVTASSANRDDFNAFMEELGPNPKSFDVENNFIVIEGIDGSGKTSLTEYFKKVPATLMKCIDIYADQLKGSGDGNRSYPGIPEIEFYHQPGFGKTGPAIREILKTVGNVIHPRVKHLLFEANRVELLQYIQEKVRPNKEALGESSVSFPKLDMTGVLGPNTYASLSPAYRSSWFVCDRHLDSTWAYQQTEDVSPQQISLVQASYNDLPRPDVTIFLYVDVEIALWRTKLRNNAGLKLDSYDIQGPNFFRSCLERYKQRILMNRGKYFIINANKTTYQIANDICDNMRLICSR